MEKQTKVLGLRECDSDKGGGGKKSENFAGLIYGRPLREKVEHFLL